MTSEHTSTTLRFAGDWPWPVGVAVAVLFAGAIFFLYRREFQERKGWLRNVLPGLRAAAVALIVLMLSGPVLHHRTVHGVLSRLMVFIDGSRSMTLTDASMGIGRKIRILQRLGLLRDAALQMDLQDASESLGAARVLAASPAATEDSPKEDWTRLTADFIARVDAAVRGIDNAGNPGNRSALIGKDLVQPAHELGGRAMEKPEDRKRAARDLAQLSEIAGRWQGDLSEQFEKSIAVGPQANPALTNALRAFDALPRWQRLQSLLLQGEEKTLSTLAEKHAVELYELSGSKVSKIWQSSGESTPLPTELHPPTGDATDLATGVSSVVLADAKGQSGAVVLLSDGQHNEGASPVELARLLGAKKIPIFTVGFGSETKPRDLAIIKVDGPESVFSEDRVRGTLWIKDDMPPGKPFVAQIKDGEKVLWQQKLTTEEKSSRSIPFDFAVSDSVKQRIKTGKEGVQISGLPLEFAVSLSQVEGDTQPENNAGTLRVRGVTQRRKILLLDGRPRWESRYLRNMFSRDEQWEMNAVIAGATRREVGFLRGQKSEQFPEDAASLQTYDLIIFGDVPRRLLKDEELKWIHDFVSERGGAVIFIDGARGSLKEYADSPIGSLLPVEWKGEPIRQEIGPLTLSGRSPGIAAFALAIDPSQNASLWKGLQPPHWLSGATPLPGAEIMAEAAVTQAVGQKIPAIIFRPFGAGRVLYHAFDDSWRWRFEVADLYHAKYWNQMANWVAELPFAVRDKFVSLDSGAITYRPGQSAEIRVRLRDSTGRPVADTVVDAVLERDGKRVATIRLTPDENAGGLFHGKTAALDRGSYEVGVETAAIPSEEQRAHTSFKVAARETGELIQLNMNEPLLRQMSLESGGRFFPEEKLDRLSSLLVSMSQARVDEADTALWGSWWWFLPIILLLTGEWILRKRSGML